MKFKFKLGKVGGLDNLNGKGNGVVARAVRARKQGGLFLSFGGRAGRRRRTRKGLGAGERLDLGVVKEGERKLVGLGLTIKLKGF